MPSVTAKRQCPDLIFVKPRFDVYKAVSQQIREIFAELAGVDMREPLTPPEQPVSVDITPYLGNYSRAGVDTEVSASTYVRLGSMAASAAAFAGVNERPSE